MHLNFEEQARFWRGVRKAGTQECWEWSGRRNSKGYGQFRYRGRAVTASRVAWSLKNDAPFPANKLACHSCDNPPCCNPDHIWPGTARENSLDAVKKGRARGLGEERCANGHELTEANIRWRYGYRRCRACDREQSRLYKLRRKARLAASGKVAAQ